MGLLDLNNDVISRGCAGALLAAMFGIFVAVTVVPSPSNIMAADQKDALAAIVPGDV
jgi:flagellar motor component MotA